MTTNKKKKSANSKAAASGVGPAVNQPVSKARAMTTMRPQYSLPDATGEARIRVRHREYLGEGMQSSLFGVHGVYPINPGLAGTFPWLSHLGHQYENYRFLSLRFDYVPYVSTASAGTVMMYLDYNSADSAPTNKAGFLSNYGAQISPIHTECTVICDPKSLKGTYGEHFTREGTPASPYDIKTYDVGTLYVAADRCGADGIGCGSIWVSYEVELFKPQLSITQEALSDSVKVLGTADSLAAPLGSASVLTGGLPVTVSADHLTFASPGEYLVELTQNGTGIANGNMKDTTSGADVTFTYLTSVITAAATSVIGSYLVKTLNPNGRVYFTGAAKATTLTGYAMRVMRYATSLA